MHAPQLPAGLWLNIPDYDAPTQMVKPAERNTKYIDMVMTIPKVRAPLSQARHQEAERHDQEDGLFTRVTSDACAPMHQRRWCCANPGCSLSQQLVPHGSQACRIRVCRARCSRCAA